jgi:threonine dehydrogenase-like Zn-dependent dehydrogenase
LIIGDGPFGVIMARLAGMLNPRHVVLAGHEDFRLGFAPSAVRVNTRTTPDYRPHLQSLAPAAGYDAVIVAVAAADAVDDAIALVKPMGRVVLFAPLPGKTAIDLFTVLVKELELVGSVNDQERMDEALRLLRAPELRLGDLVTHRFTLDDYRAAFALAEHSRDAAMKVAITFPDLEHQTMARGLADEDY